jgi:hypothetical protein
LEGFTNHNCRNPVETQNLLPISLLSTTGKSFEIILRTIQTHTEERNLLNASQFGFRADDSTTLQYMRLVDRVTLNFSNNMWMVAKFLHIEETFDTTWHSGLLHKLLKQEFSTSSIKIIVSFLTDRKFKVLVEGEFSTPRKIAVGVPQGSTLASICTLYI